MRRRIVMAKQIVSVQFESRYRPGEYGGCEYSYFVADGINLKVGDIVKVTTRNGEGYARVSRVGLRESQIDERVMPFMRTIESGPVEQQ